MAIDIKSYNSKFKPSKTAKAYKEIWMKEENMSPLLYYTQKQAEKVGNILSNEKINYRFCNEIWKPQYKK